MKIIFKEDGNWLNEKWITIKLTSSYNLKAYSLISYSNQLEAYINMEDVVVLGLEEAGDMDLEDLYLERIMVYVKFKTSNLSLNNN